MRESRAIVFDLDDTLYPYRAFVRSGFAAAAAHIAEATGVPARRVYRALCRASAAARGRELQRVCERYGIAEATIPRLVHLMKWHTPAIRLPRETRQVLLRLQAAWRIGILTNGEPAIQRRKLAALGLPPLVDAAVCAAECGTGRGKPDGEAFAAVVDRLGVAPERSVFVGDDPEADVAGAVRAGLQAIHFVGHRRTARPSLAPHATIARFCEIPAAAARLIGGAQHDRRPCGSPPRIGSAPSGREARFRRVREGSRGGSREGTSRLTLVGDGPGLSPRACGVPPAEQALIRNGSV